MGIFFCWKIPPWKRLYPRDWFGIFKNFMENVFSKRFLEVFVKVKAYANYSKGLIFSYSF